MFEAAAGEDHCRLACEGARWLVTGQRGGYADAATACILTVPADFDRTDVAPYVAERRARLDLPAAGPTLLTAVDAAHARGARAGDVRVVATAGLTNPASLPVGSLDAPLERPADALSADERPPPFGTVNLLVGTSRALGDGTLAELLATAVEAKTATVTAVAGFSGTTSDAVAVGCDPGGEPVAFAGSGTGVGAATRACVRDAVCASLAAGDRAVPASVADADHGTVTTVATETFRP